MTREKVGQWINEYVDLPIESILCRLNFHRITWERWDGVEHCYCGKCVVDNEGFYEEKE